METNEAIQGNDSNEHEETSFKEEREADFEWNERETIKELLERLITEDSNRISLKILNKDKNSATRSTVYLDGVEQHYIVCHRCKNLGNRNFVLTPEETMGHLCFKGGNEYFAKRSIDFQSNEMNSLSNVCKRAKIEELILQQSPRIGYIPNHKGKSGVWSQFLIITLDNVPMNFASCMSCRNIVTYTSRTGTGSMTRHRCQNTAGFRRYVKQSANDVELQPVAIKIKQKHCGLGYDRVYSTIIKSQDPDDGWENKRIKQEKIDDFEENGYQQRLSIPGKRTPETFPQRNRYLEERTNNLPLEYDNPSSSDYVERLDRPIITKEAREKVQLNQLRFLKSALPIFEIFQGESFLDLAQSLVDIGAHYGKVDVRQIFTEKKNVFHLNEDIKNS